MKQSICPHQLKTQDCAVCRYSRLTYAVASAFRSLRRGPVTCERFTSGYSCNSRSQTIRFGHTYKIGGYPVSEQTLWKVRQLKKWVEGDTLTDEGWRVYVDSNGKTEVLESREAVDARYETDRELARIAYEAADKKRYPKFYLTPSTGHFWICETWEVFHDLHGNRLMCPITLEPWVQLPAPRTDEPLDPKWKSLREFYEVQKVTP